MEIINRKIYISIKFKSVWMFELTHKHDTQVNEQQ